jgi:hypothetical protein
MNEGKLQLYEIKCFYIIFACLMDRLEDPIS